MIYQQAPPPPPWWQPTHTLSQMWYILRCLVNKLCEGNGRLLVTHLIFAFDRSAQCSKHPRPIAARHLFFPPQSYPVLTRMHPMSPLVPG